MFKIEIKDGREAPQKPSMYIVYTLLICPFVFNKREKG